MRKARMVPSIAIELASRESCRALVVFNGFTSFPDMAQWRFPWLPGRWLVSNKMHNERKIATVQAPVFVSHGTADGVVPYFMGERLYAAAHEPKDFLQRDGDGHNHPATREPFGRLQAFLRKHPGPARLH